MVPFCAGLEKMKSSYIVKWLQGCMGFTMQRCNYSTIQRLACLLFGVCCFSASAAETNTLLSSWLGNQEKIKTWSADFVQTRTLKSFSEPLVSTGKVWFAAPTEFLWELGNPAQTIAVRQKEQMLVLYPKLKRVEKYPLAGNQSGPWKDVLALLEAGFPRSQQEMESRFNVRLGEMKGEVCEVVLQPKSSSARKMMPQMKLAFSTNDFSLRATELQFADGSTMRNDFQNPQVNEKVDELLFSPEIPADYKVVEPMKQKK